MELYRRKPKGPWHVTLITPSGIRIRQTTKETDKGKAQAFANTLVARLQEAAGASQGGRRAIPLGEALSAYTDSLEAAKKPSADLWDMLRRKTLGEGSFAHRFHLDANMWLHDLTPMDLERLIQGRRKEGNSAQTIVHELNVLKAATRYVKGLLYRVPDFDDWRKPTVKQKTRYLSWEEFCRLYDSMDPDRPMQHRLKDGSPGALAPVTGKFRKSMQDLQDLLVALAMCGGRWSEVAALTWDRVDVTTGTVRLFATKTGGERSIGMPPQFASVLTRRFAERDPMDTLVFPSRGGKVRTGACQPLLRAMTRAGLNREDIVERYGKATVHSLRHTYASWLLQNGADLAEVQDALGHASMQMTRRYAHLAKAKTREKLKGIMGSMGQIGAPSERA